jgi:hypothetical protein
MTAGCDNDRRPAGLKVNRRDADIRAVIGRQRMQRASADRAALAYSVLPLDFAQAVHDCLSVPEHHRLRDALVRVSDASTDQRHDALRHLLAAVRKGIVFPFPAAHQEDRCPFHSVAQLPDEIVVVFLEQLAVRQPMEAAVTLCHLPSRVQHQLWDALAPETRAVIVPLLEDVHGLSAASTREYARDVRIRLSQLDRSLAHRRGSQ